MAMPGQYIFLLTFMYGSTKIEISRHKEIANFSVCKLQTFTAYLSHCCDPE